MKNEIGLLGIVGRHGMLSSKVLENLYYPYAEREVSRVNSKAYLDKYMDWGL